MFIDEAKINVKSGKGGDGAVHFRREKYVPRGGPDGGDGGRGGDVILKVLHTLNTLNAFRYKEKYVADDGKNGAKQKMTGRSAKDLIIPVPPGTIVYDADSGDLLGDLINRDQELRVCKGGRGGRGNVHFVSARHQVPKVGEKGEPGEEKNLKLVLKLIADVGIVGVPNAGKSSFLTAVTNATPKIADYPFTTLEPNLGVSELDAENSLVFADIPGIIEGAHHGAGLGDAFLRHIQRTKAIIHLLDGSSEDPLADFTQINSEMSLFDPQLAEKQQLVVINKIDLEDVKAKWPKLKNALKKRGYEAMAISALTRQDLKPVIWKALELVRNAPEIKTEERIPVYRPEVDPMDYTIERIDEGYQVHGKAIERAAQMTYWEHEESIRRFQKLLTTLGVDDALRALGIEEGESVFIGDFELEWQD